MADVLTNAGEAFIIDELDAFGTYYLAWGTGAGTAAKGDTTLLMVVRLSLMLVSLMQLR